MGHDILFVISFEGPITGLVKVNDDRLDLTQTQLFGPAGLFDTGCELSLLPFWLKCLLKSSTSQNISTKLCMAGLLFGVVRFAPLAYTILDPCLIHNSGVLAIVLDLPSSSI